MPSETATAPAVPDADDDAAEAYYKKFWEQNVSTKIGHKTKWAEFKDRPMTKVVDNMTSLRNQCELWGQRCKSAHEESDARAIDNYKAEVVLLLRLMELCVCLLMGEDRHPDNLKKEDKKKLMQDQKWAVEKLEHSKPRLKRYVLKLYKERLRTQAANTKKVGDALEGNRPIMNAGDAMIREGLTQLPGGGGSVAKSLYAPAMPSQSPPAPLPAGFNNGAAGGWGSGANGGLRGQVDDDDDVFIAVPADDGDIPNLLPEQNRMTWNTFMQHQRPQPGQVPHWRMAPPQQRPPQQLPPRGAAQAGAVVAQPWAGASHGALPQLGQPMPSGAVDPYDAQLQEALRQSALLSQRENEKTARLKERLARYTEYELEDVDNTGHCQFDAIAHQIFGRFANAYPNLMRGGPTYTYRQVRKDIANWLRHNASAPLDKDGTSKISDFLDEEDGATWELFCDNVEDIRMSPGPLWGNHLTLIAAANCYQRPIRVWSTAPGDDWWLQIEPKHYKASTHNIRPFELAHLYERHYLSVTERKGPRPMSTPQY